MCEPTLILAASTAVVGYIGDKQQADAEEVAQRDHYEQTKRAADADFANKYNAETSALTQQDIANSRELTQSAIDRTNAAATASVAAGEAGVSGVNLDMLMFDYKRQEANYKDAITQQFEFDKQAAVDNIKAYGSQQASRVNDARPSPVKRPSFLGAALKIGGAAVDSGVFKKKPTTSSKGGSYV